MVEALAGGLVSGSRIVVSTMVRAGAGSIIVSCTDDLLRGGAVVRQLADVSFSVSVGFVFSL